MAREVSLSDTTLSLIGLWLSFASDSALLTIVRVYKLYLLTYLLTMTGFCITLCVLHARQATYTAIITRPCTASFLGCQHGTARICWWAPAPAVGRHLLPAVRSVANPPHVSAAVDRRDRQTSNMILINATLLLVHFLLCLNSMSLSYVYVLLSRRNLSRGIMESPAYVCLSVCLSVCYHDN